MQSILFKNLPSSIIEEASKLPLLKSKTDTRFQEIKNFYEKNKEMLDSNIQAYEKIDNIFLFKLYNKLGAYHELNGNNTEAFNSYRISANQIPSAKFHPRDVLHILKKLLSTVPKDYVKLGEITFYAEKIVKLLESKQLDINNEDIVQEYINVADLYFKNGEYDKSEIQLYKALEISQNSQERNKEQEVMIFIKLSFPKEDFDCKYPRYSELSHINLATAVELCKEINCKPDLQVKIKSTEAKLFSGERKYLEELNSLMELKDLAIRINDSKLIFSTEADIAIAKTHIARKLESDKNETFLPLVFESLKTLEDSISYSLSHNASISSYEVAGKLPIITLNYGLFGDCQKVTEYAKLSYNINFITKNMNKTIPFQERLNFFKAMPIKKQISSVLCSKYYHFGEEHTLDIEKSLPQKCLHLRGEKDPSLEEYRGMIKKYAKHDPIAFELLDEKNKYLSKIYSLAQKNKFQCRGFFFGLFFPNECVEKYLRDEELRKTFVDNNEPVIDSRVQKLKMLAFERASLGFMNSKDRDFQPIMKLAKNFPDLMEKIATEHPEYFVDASIACAIDQELSGKIPEITELY